ncbi:XRE family transcriptional regulator [Kineococcus vitellinus]|uniref:helix-turn-helix domain-containing protein n=1 Tax=Kineococcus vitellinus TaxID=2696565 RepID=UPI0030B82A05
MPAAEPDAEPGSAGAPPLEVRLAQALRAARLARGFSTAALAQLSGVSRAMIVKVERGDSQPTAALLGRLCAALGLTLSELFGRVEQPLAHSLRLLRAQDQREWEDPATGYLRRVLSPAAGGPLQLTRIELPAGASVSYPADAYAGIHQQVWVLSGDLEVHEGAEAHRLAAGDCLELGPPRECTFTNPGAAPVRYLVAVAHRRP